MTQTRFAVVALFVVSSAAAQTWTLLSPPAKPPSRFDTSMTYYGPDAVLFGGSHVTSGGYARLNDTWLWSGTTWTQANPPHKPQARSRHAMVYDENRREVLLFGGMAADGSALGDTWVWNGSDWTQRTPPVSPTARYWHAMAYDPVRKEVILFGGTEGSGGQAETWAWNGTTWRSVTAANSPPGRNGHAMAWNPETQKVLLYGGNGQPDTWLWDGSNWQAVNSGVNPGSRTEFVLLPDLRSGRTILIGGQSSAYATQTWSFASTGWQQLVTPAPPPARSGMAGAYDVMRGSIVMFGGWLTNETWTFNSGGLCAFTAPEVRIDVTAAGSSGEFAPPVAAGCAWTASSDAAWLTLTTASGTGPSALRYTAAENPGVFERAARIAIHSREYIVYQAAPLCPSGESLPVNSVRLRNECSVTFVHTAAAGDRIALRGLGRGVTYGPRDFYFSSYATFTITGPAPATTVVGQATYRAGHDAVTYLPASGLLTLPSAGTYNVSVSLSGGAEGSTLLTALTSRAACAPDLRFYNTQGLFALDSITSLGGQYRASVGVQPGCSGAVSSGAQWVTASTASVPEGFSEFDVSLAPNYGPERATILTVGGTPTPIRQLAGQCGYSLSPLGATVPASGATGTVDLITALLCTWQTSSSAGWLQPYPLSGEGTGHVLYTVFPNFKTTQRTASIAIANQTFTVTQMANTGTAMQRFVQLLYFSYFGRIPSQPEIDFQVNSGLSREQLALNFFNSEEFNIGGRFVAGLYAGILNRDAEYGGWLFQRNALATHLVEQDSLVANFLASKEYRDRFGAPMDADFVRQLYRQVLLREPHQPEVDFQVNALVAFNAQGKNGRAIISRNFLNAPEFRVGVGPRLTAFLAYATLAQRQASAQEFAAAAAIAQRAQALTDPVARQTVLRDELLAPLISIADLQ